METSFYFERPTKKKIDYAALIYSQVRLILDYVFSKFMNGSDNGADDAGFAGMGRWFAVASEIPCSVVALLLVGQIAGTAILGPSGAVIGALVGALTGFVLGVYGVYITINFYDKMEKTGTPRKPYMPPREEIFEDVKFDLDESKEID